MEDKFYTAEHCRRKANQHWEMAGLARQDRDSADEQRQTKLARLWDQRARDDGWMQSEEKGGD